MSEEPQNKGAGHLDVQSAVLTDGQLELGNLVALGQVGIEVVFAGEAVVPVQGGIRGQPQPDRKFHHPAVQNRQGSGHAQTDRAGMGVGRRAKLGGAGAEDLAVGLELGMHLQPDDGFKFHDMHL